MYSLRWSLPARRDLQEIFQYYSNEIEDCNIELGQEILRRIVLPTQNLITLPLTGRPGRIRNTREILAENAPYVTVYRIVGDIVEIIRVLHTSRLFESAFYFPAARVKN